MDSTPVVQAPVVSHSAEDAGHVSDVIDQATANLIARVNAVSLTAEDLSHAAAEIQKTIPVEDCDRKARIGCLAPMFKGQGCKAFAVNYRLEAMARVVGKLPDCWALPGTVKESVFLAAAKEPILFTNKQWSFESKSFVAFVLENAEVDGHA